MIDVFCVDGWNSASAAEVAQIPFILTTEQTVPDCPDFTRLAVRGPGGRSSVDL